MLYVGVFVDSVCSMRSLLVRQELGNGKVVKFVLVMEMLRCFRTAALSSTVRGSAPA